MFLILITIVMQCLGIASILFATEVTNTEQYKGIYTKFKQSRGHNHREPLLIIKMNRQQPLAVISLEHFFELLEKED